MTKKQVKPRQKNLSLKQIQQKMKDINTLSTFVYDEESNTVIKYYEKFSPQRIEAVLKECHDKLLYCEEHEISYFKKDTNFLHYVYFLLIKHMSNIGKDISDKFEDQLVQFDAIVTSGLFELFFTEIYDLSEVQLVVERLQSFMALSAKIAELDEATREKLLNTVESPVIKKRLESASEVNG